jgi:hypothetical protein
MLARIEPFITNVLQFRLGLDTPWAPMIKCMYKQGYPAKKDRGESKSLSGVAGTERASMVDHIINRNDPRFDAIPLCGKGLWDELITERAARTRGGEYVCWECLSIIGASPEDS